MPRRVAQNVSLTPEHAAFIAGLVASGRYAGVSEVVREDVSEVVREALDALARREPRRAARRQADADRA